jgi:hypothetical protein
VTVPDACRVVRAMRAEIDNLRAEVASLRAKGTK